MEKTKIFCEIDAIKFTNELSDKIDGFSIPKIYIDSMHKQIQKTNGKINIQYSLKDEYSDNEKTFLTLEISKDEIKIVYYGESDDNYIHHSSWTSKNYLTLTPTDISYEDQYNAYYYSVTRLREKDYEGCYFKDDKAKEKKVLTAYLSTLAEYWDNDEMKKYYKEFFENESTRNSDTTKKSLRILIEDYKKEQKNIQSDKKNVNRILGNNENFDK